MRPTKITLTFSDPADLIVETMGVVWAKDLDGTFYSVPHYSFSRTLIKLPRPPKVLIVYSTENITGYNVLPFDPTRRLV